MDKHKAMHELSQQLRNAAAAADWPALAAADRATAALLPRLVAAGPLDAAEQHALARLRAVHEAARQRCTEAHAAVSLQLRDLQNHREGWLAYAMAGEESLT